MKTAALWIGSMVIAGSAFGQAMIERGAAAITGSSAGVGIGKSIGNVLKNVDRALGDAANQGRDFPANPSSRVPAVKEPALKLTLPPGPFIKQNAGVASRPQMIGPSPAPESASAVPVEPAPAPAPVLPAFNREAMQEVKEGSSRDELIAKVGAPFFKLTLPEGNHAVEIYRYRANGEDAAVVKLLDGVITSVEVFSR